APADRMVTPGIWVPSPAAGSVGRRPRLRSASEGPPHAEAAEAMAARHRGEREPAPLDKRAKAWRPEPAEPPGQQERRRGQVRRTNVAVTVRRAGPAPGVFRGTLVGPARRWLAPTNPDGGWRPLGPQAHQESQAAAEVAEAEVAARQADAVTS
ncbi:MAG: hypothetical protein ACI81R_000678, partial [Bradymonadia bacterium]